MSKKFPALLLAVALFSATAARADWVSTGPYGGSAQIVAIDPSNPQVLLAGTRNALLYRSENAGDLWTPLPFPYLYNSSIYSIAIDPKQSSVYYVGVANDTAKQSADSPAGIYKSEDSGQHWSRLDEMNGKSVYALAIWGGDVQAIAAGTDQGVWKTGDAGKSWKRISSPANTEMSGIVSLAFHPSNQNVLYAGTPHLPWKTSDGGQTWTTIHTGMIDDSDVFSIRVDATDPERIFASACSGIYCSRNGGELWSKLQGIPKTDGRTHVIAQDPQHSSTLYAGTTMGLWKSNDAGLTWVKKSDHDINGMAIDPSDSRILYLASDSTGIIKSSDAGETFHSSNQGFVNRSITAFGLSAGDKPSLWASTAYDGGFGGIFSSADAGDSWSLVATHARLLDENVITFAVSPGDSHLIWAASYDGLLRSVDGGKTWTRPLAFLEIPPKRKARPAHSKGIPVRTPGRPVLPAFPPEGVRIDALRAAGTLLIAGASTGIYVSRDGIYWHPAAKGPESAVYSIFLSPGSNESLAAITHQGLYISTDHGTNWNRSELPRRPESFYAVALHPMDPSILFAASSDGLWRSEDGGLTWSLCEKGLPTGWINAIAFDVSHPQQVFAAQLGNLYESRDGGLTWLAFDNKGLEQVWVRSLWVNSEVASRLVAVSNARGVYVRRGDGADAGPGMQAGARASNR